jgi:hypothetical protein
MERERCVALHDIALPLRLLRLLPLLALLVLLQNSPLTHPLLHLPQRFGLEAGHQRHRHAVGVAVLDHVHEGLGGDGLGA